jgi:hypothetical protein
LKITNTEGAGGVAQGVSPEFKSQHHKKKNSKPFIALIPLLSTDENYNQRNMSDTVIKKPSCPIRTKYTQNPTENNYKYQQLTHT